VAYQLVGTTSYTGEYLASFPYTHSIPVPTGTQVGDLLVVGFWGGSGHSVPDTRLTTVNRVSPTTPAGAYGVATDLSDVQIETDYLFNRTAIIVVAVRDYGTIETTLARCDGSLFDPIINPGAAPDYNASVAFVIDSGAPGGLPGDDADWVTSQTAVYGNYYNKCYTFSGTGGIPGLSATYDAGASNRSAFWIQFTAILPGTATDPTYLRQRQSPVRTPSRNRPVDIRNRQTPITNR